MTAAQPGQMPCPDCQTVITLPIEQILNGEAISCSGCGLELRVDTENSGKAIEALKRWHEETREAREKAAEGDSPVRPRRRSRARRPRS